MGANIFATSINLPLMIEIEPTHSCNLRCFMCHVPHQHLTNEWINVARLLQILEVFRGQGTWVSVGAAYEPVIHPEFVRLIHGLSDLGMNIEITTNGTLLHRHITDQLAGATIKQVYFSFDGIRKETYENIRINATFEKTVSNLLYFRERFSQTGCYINYVITKSNISEICEAVKFWESHNFDIVGYINMVQRGDYPRVKNESVVGCQDAIREQFEKAADLIILNNFHISIGSSVITHMDALKKKYPDNIDGNMIRSNRSDVVTVFNPRSLQSGPYPGMPVDCRSPFTFARFMYNGNVILCNDKFPIGNIYQNDFQGIWSGEYATEIRAKIMSDSSICNHCDYYRFCLNASQIDNSKEENFYSESLLKDGAEMNDDTFSERVAREATGYYTAIRQDYTASGYDKTYELNFFWSRDNMTKLMEIIYSPSDAHEKIAAIQNTFMYSINTKDDTIKNRMIDWYLEYLLSIGIHLDDLDLQIQESQVSNHSNTVVRHGRLLTPDFLRTVILCLEIRKHCTFGVGRLNVLELGAGYGGLARTFRHFFPETCYTIIDIPETLYFSYLFLRLNYPNARVHYVTSEHDLPAITTDYDYIFVPTKYASLLTGKSYDLFCNTASLGEMKNSVISHWMDFVQNGVAVKYFFGLNRFLNTIDPERHAWRLDENICSVSFDQKWRILKWELEPQFTRCPYLETIVSRNLEIIAERLPDTYVNPDYFRLVSTQLTNSLAEMDIFIHANEDNSMLLRDNPFGHDFTQRGVLFKLWEAIRLSPGVENVSLMLAYLKLLMGKRPFEEMFYYQSLLEQLQPGEKIRKFWERPYSHTPQLIESGYFGFNIVHFGDDYFGLAQSLGPIDLTLLREDDIASLCQSRKCFIGNSVQEIKNSIGSSLFQMG